MPAWPSNPRLRRATLSKPRGRGVGGGGGRRLRGLAGAAAAASLAMPLGGHAGFAGVAVESPVKEGYAFEARGRGETGRRAGFRSRWASALGGSIPLARMPLG